MQEKLTQHYKSAVIEFFKINLGKEGIQSNKMLCLRGEFKIISVSAIHNIYIHFFYNIYIHSFFTEPQRLCALFFNSQTELKANYEKKKRKTSQAEFL